jgi:hypothetical protein
MGFVQDRGRRCEFLAGLLIGSVKTILQRLALSSNSAGKCASFISRFVTARADRSAGRERVGAYAAEVFIAEAA